MHGRLARMSPASERAATFASGPGRRFTIHDLASMTGMSLAELIDPVNELVQAEIFADDGGTGVPARHHPGGSSRQLLSPVRRAVDQQAAEVLRLSALRSTTSSPAAGQALRYRPRRAHRRRGRRSPSQLTRSVERTRRLRSATADVASSVRVRHRLHPAVLEFAPEIRQRRTAT
jgi:hypothetical protein